MLPKSLQDVPKPQEKVPKSLKIAPNHKKRSQQSPETKPRVTSRSLTHHNHNTQIFAPNSVTTKPFSTFHPPQTRPSFPPRDPLLPAPRATPNPNISPTPPFTCVHFLQRLVGEEAEASVGDDPQDGGGEAPVQGFQPFLSGYPDENVHNAAVPGVGTRGRADLRWSEPGLFIQGGFIGNSFGSERIRQLRGDGRWVLGLPRAIILSFGVFFKE